jgi:hypothetical protein
MVLSLPADAWRSIAWNLSAPDVLAFLSVHRQINKCLGQSPSFWCRLLLRDCENDEEERNGSFDDARIEYMVKAYKNHILSCKWHPVSTEPRLGISAREGHLACVLHGLDNEKRICLNGGFADDRRVYIINVPSKQKQATTNDTAWTYDRINPQNGTSFVYGASFTELPPVSEEDDVHVGRAIQFGGFRSGGYSDETNEVWLLNIKDELQRGGESQITASWEMVPTNNPEFAVPRAYHTATLLGDRYLVVIGGMMWRQSILSEAILDTHTWTWLDQQISTHGDKKPSGRHGHSVVLDSKRNRLVIFGGGSGTDILLSGQDNKEVWELKMNGEWKTTLRFPWAWSIIHDNRNDNELGQEDNDDEAMSTTEQLSPAESLCLGRCHHGLKVSPDTALLFFGSGRPSTNHVIGYSLQTDRFLRPKISGKLPKPRFSGVAVFLETEGYIFTHGGYVSQEGDCTCEMNILDLAPFLNRNFEGLPPDSNRQSFREITNEEANQGGQNFLRALTLGIADINDVNELLALYGRIRIGNNEMIIAQEIFEGTDEADSDNDSDFQDYEVG